MILFLVLYLIHLYLSVILVVKNDTNWQIFIARFLTYCLTYEKVSMTYFLQALVAVVFDCNEN